MSNNEQDEVKQFSEYVQVLKDIGEKSIPEMITKSAFVFLTRWQRIKLAFSILKTLTW